MRTYNNIWKNGTGQGDYYTTGCFRDHPYFKEPYKQCNKLILLGI